MGLINAINCNKEDLGLGIVECEQYLKRLSFPILIKKNWRMLVEDFQALDDEGITALVQNGSWQPVVGAKNFTPTIPDPQQEELSNATVIVTENGKPTFQFDYDKGIKFHQNLFSKNSFGLYNIGLVDEAGTLVLALSADKKYVTGLTAGTVNTNSYVPQNGTTASNTPFWFQLINVEQYNRRMALYTADQSGIDFNEQLSPITSVNIQLVGTAEAGEPITVSVKAITNSAYGIEGLVADNFRIVNTVTNSVVPITTVVPGTNAGDYIITPATPTTAGQVLEVTTYDATATPPVNVAIIEPNQLYKGISSAITVAASLVGVFAVMFTNTFA